MPVDDIASPGMTREQIVGALTRLGELLWQQKRRGEIAVFGGTAVVLRHEFRAATRAVGAKIEREHGAVVAASQAVARSLACRVIG